MTVWGRFSAACKALRYNLRRSAALVAIFFARRKEKIHHGAHSEHREKNPVTAGTT
jgi:hypothetical protein